MSLARRCSRTPCGRPAVQTLTYVYADQTAVLGPLATFAEPHAYDLCALHGERLSAPRGWEVLRLAVDPSDRGPSDGRPARPGRRRARGRPSAGAATASRRRRSRPRDHTPRAPARPHHRLTPGRPTRAAPAPTRVCWSWPSTLDPANVHAIFKAYDVRGTVPDQLDEELARATGRAYVQVTGATEVVVGYDMRPSSPGMAGAFADGATDGRRRRHDDRPGLDRPALLRLGPPRHAGRDVHRQPQPGAVQRHQDVPGARAADRPGDRARRDPRPGGLRRLRRPPTRTGSITEHDVLEAYAAHLLSLAPRPPDAGSRSSPTPATAWPATPRRPSSAGSATRSSWCRCTSSSTARSRTTRPTRSRPTTSSTCRPRCSRSGPTSAWPSTATPTAASSSTSSAARCRRRRSPRLIAERELAKDPGATVIHNLITSRAVPELVTELGGTPVRTRVGHSFIKATMAETNAIFGGEHSGHFYFRDFWRADSGMLAALHALAALAGHRRAALRAARRATSATRCRARSTRPSADAAGDHRGDRGDVRRPRRRHHRPPRRAHRQPRRLAVQRALLQHRAAAAAQRRGQGRGDDGGDARRRARPDPRRELTA